MNPIKHLVRGSALFGGLLAMACFSLGNSPCPEVAAPIQETEVMPAVQLTQAQFDELLQLVQSQAETTGCSIPQELVDSLVSGNTNIEQLQAVIASGTCNQLAAAAIAQGTEAATSSQEIVTLVDGATAYVTSEGALALEKEINAALLRAVELANTPAELEQIIATAKTLGTEYAASAAFAEVIATAEQKLVDLTSAVIIP